MRIAAGFLAAILAAGCASGPPTKYPNTLTGVHSYAGSFADAGAVAIVKDETGRDYFDLPVEAYYQPHAGPRRLCGAGDIASWPDAPQTCEVVSLKIANPLHDPDYKCRESAERTPDGHPLRTTCQRNKPAACDDLDGCGVLTIDPALLADPKAMAALKAALADPCRYLASPAKAVERLHKNPAYRHREPSGILHELREDWSFLRCGADPTRRISAHIEAIDGGEVRIAF